MITENENQPPFSTQGDANEQEDQLGGTTNLSLEQLKQEGGANNLAEDNPNRLDDVDDLHEIQAADDVSEPNLDDFHPEPVDDSDSQDHEDANQSNNTVPAEPESRAGELL